VCGDNNRTDNEVGWGDSMAAGVTGAKVAGVVPRAGRLAGLPRPARMAVAVIPLVLVQTYGVGFALHYLHPANSTPKAIALAAVLPTHDGRGGHRPMPTSAGDQFVHFLRDSTLALPSTFVLLLLAAFAVRRLLAGVDADTVKARLVFVVAASLAVALASVPSVYVHGWLFDERLPASVPMAQHLAEISLLTLRYTFALALGYVLLFGVPWRALEYPPKAAHQAGT
jgi:hypothetical protein